MNSHPIKRYDKHKRRYSRFYVIMELTIKIIMRYSFHAYKNKDKILTARNVQEYY